MQQEVIKVTTSVETFKFANKAFSFFISFISMYVFARMYGYRLSVGERVHTHVGVGACSCGYEHACV